MTGARVISLLRTLVLARLLAPDDFGLFAIGIVTVEVAISLTNFGLREALIQRSDGSAVQYDAAWTLEMARALGVAVVIALMAPIIAAIFFKEPAATNVIRLVTLVPVLDHAASIRMVDLARELRFRPLAIVNLTGALIQTTTAIALASSLGVYAIVVGSILGAAIQSGTSYVVAPHVPRFAMNRLSLAPLLAFGRWIFTREIFDIIGVALVHAVIARTLGAGALGVYSIAVRLTFFPSEAARRVVGSVAFPLYTQLQSDNARTGRALRSSIVGLGVLLVPGYVLLGIMTPELVVLLIGEKWMAAVGLIRILCLCALLRIVADSVIPLFDGRGSTEVGAVQVAIRSVVVLATVPFLVPGTGVIGAGVGWSLAEGLGGAFAAIMITRSLPGAYRGLSARCATLLLAGVASGGIVYLARQIGAVEVGIGIASLAGPSVFLVSLWTLDRVFALGMLGEVRALFPNLPIPGTPRSRTIP